MSGKITIFFVFLLLYNFWIPLFFQLVNAFKMYSVSTTRKRPIQKKQTELQLGYIDRTKREKKYLYKRTPIGKKVQITMFVIPIFVSLIALLNWKTGLFFVVFIPLITNAIIHNKVKDKLAVEDTLIDRLLTFKRQKMGLLSTDANKYNYNTEFRIDEWDEKGKISKLVLYLPVTFDPLGATRFLMDMSVQFGGGRVYEIDETNNECNGWNTEKGMASLYLVDALPEKAEWSAHYIEDPMVQWSFFPLGLSTKGGLPIKNPKTGEVEHVIGYDCDGTQYSYCQKNGINIGNDIIAAPHLLVAGTTGSGKSVLQRNVIYSCLGRPKDWLLMGIDLKKVELGMLRKYGVQVATTYQDAGDLAAFCQKVMMDRYELMESLGVNNWKDVPEEHQGPAIMLMIDEAAELLEPISGKDDESKVSAESQDIARSAISSIARLGRASRVFMIVATQRPSSDVIPMQIRQNLPARTGCGALPSTISGMVFENGDGQRIRSSPKGGIGIKIHSSQVYFGQGFFAEEGWIDGYLTSKGLPINVYSEDAMLASYEEQKQANASNLPQQMTEEDFDLIDDAING